MEFFKYMEKLSKFWDKNKELIYPYLAGFLVFLFGIWGIWREHEIIVLSDEYGYWEHAASFAGLDWSAGIIDKWYGFGYSLILMPIIQVFSTMKAMYFSAILLNGLMLVGCFVLMRKLTNRFFGGLGEHTRLGICTVACLYPPLLSQTKIAWAETLISLLFLLLFYLIIQIEDKYETDGKIDMALVIGASLVAGFLFITHNRAVVVLAALCVWAVIFARKIILDGKAKELIPFVLAVLVVTVMIFFNHYVKDIFVSGLTNNYNPTNEFSGRAWRIKAFFTGDGFMQALYAFSGSIVYFAIASGFAGLVGVGTLLPLKKKSDRYFDWSVSAKWFLIVSFGLMMALTAVMSMSPGEMAMEAKLSNYFYGRYVDAISPVYVMLGLGVLMEVAGIEQVSIKKTWPNALICVLLYFVAADLAYTGILSSESTTINMICTPAAWLFAYIPNHNFLLFALVFLPVGVIMYLWCIPSSFGEKKVFEIEPVAWNGGLPHSSRWFLVLLGLLFVISAGVYTRTEIKVYHNALGNTVEWLEKNCEGNPLYVLRSETTVRQYYQANLPKRRINLIERNDLKDIKAGLLISDGTRPESILTEVAKCKRYHIYWIGNPEDFTPIEVEKPKKEKKEKNTSNDGNEAADSESVIDIDGSGTGIEAVETDNELSLPRINGDNSSGANNALDEETGLLNGVKGGSTNNNQAIEDSTDNTSKVEVIEGE